jgi:hypothetical protein
MREREGDKTYKYMRTRLLERGGSPRSRKVILQWRRVPSRWRRSLQLRKGCWCRHGGRGVRKRDRARLGVEDLLCALECRDEGAGVGEFRGEIGGGKLVEVEKLRIVYV